MFKTNMGALKSFFAYKYNDFKKEMTIGIAICAGLYIAQLAVVIILSQVEGNGGGSNAGMLIIGASVLLITFFIGVFVNTSNSEIKNLFRFPINRPTYAVGSLLYILLLPLAVIAASSAFYLLEFLAYKALSAIIGNVLYINTVTAINYLEGLLPTYATCVFALSVIHMLSMYFHRFKLPFTMALALFIFAVIFLPGFRLWFAKAFTYGFRIKSMLPFAAYMLGVSLAAHVLAFIPLKTMEVKS